jgi:hypothetical protein
VANRFAEIDARVLAGEPVADTTQASLAVERAEYLAAQFHKTKFYAGSPLVVGLLGCLVGLLYGDVVVFWLSVPGVAAGLSSFWIFSRKERRALRGQTANQALLGPGTAPQA